MTASPPINQTGKRNTNLELFRIISMLFIVAHHYVVNSGMTAVMAENPFAANSLFFYLFGAWGKTGINCFVMITGYFMCKSQISFKKFLKLLLQIEFYKFVFYFVFIYFGYYTFSFKKLVFHMLPIISIDSSFTQAFILFYLFIYSFFEYLD